MLAIAAWEFIDRQRLNRPFHQLWEIIKHIDYIEAFNQLLEHLEYHKALTVAGWFAPRKYQAPPATEVSAYPSDWVRSAGRQPLRDLKLAHLLSERLFRRVIRHPK